MIIPLREVPTHNLRRATIANAIATSTYTLAPGTALQPGATGHTKFVTQATSSNPILGIVLGIEFLNGISELNSVIGVNAASTVAGTNIKASVYNDNETTGYYRVIYIPSNIPVDYTADLSANSGTTTDSAGNGFFNLIAATTGATGGATLDETSITLFGGTAGQFWSYGSVTEPIVNKKQAIVHVYKTL